MLGALILGVWLLLSIDRAKQTFWEASLFTFIVMVAISLMDWSLPHINAIWLFSWFVLWLYAFVVFWLLDVVSVNFISGAVFSVAAGIGYFFLQSHAYALATQWLN
ncbi:hypothetical protein [Snodgrassella sp. CFCC 13594]|uniref:hypothetical protein n=1 Tax=Snodgrassella sp. CFCC 13594 TaxID=1775559 RepID=UPI0008316A48|nr:hypothetical protein [Snodgrassella sp. CFCC 13594]